MTEKFFSRIVELNRSPLMKQQNWSFWSP